MDGCAEHRKDREAPTQISIKMAAGARPMLEQIAEHFGRRLCARANGQYVLTFTDKPVARKTQVPDLQPDHVPYYVRGLLDGDGCVSGARVKDRLYPYVSLVFNPQREAWVGAFHGEFLSQHGIKWRSSR
jgi:hypothetical protein